MAARASVFLLFACMGVASAAAETVTVTQRGRMFEPAAIEISVGDTVRIVNDDGELLHHAYLEDPAFSFDIGEQPGGTSNDVAFPVAGVFNVFCGIHPKMGLTVTVR
jgi:plastocyanin